MESLEATLEEAGAGFDTVVMTNTYCPALTTGLPSTRPTLATSSSAMFVERGLERWRDVHAVSSHVKLAKRSLQNAGQILLSARDPQPGLPAPRSEDL